MFSETLKELITISKLPKIPKDTRRKVRALIRELYLNGFTAGEIESLTEGRWKASTIKKYCGDLEVKDTKMKDKALDLLKEFIERDGSWDEMEYYLDSKKLLEDYTLEEILGFKKDFDDHDVDLPTFGLLTRKLDEVDVTWEDFLHQFKTYMDLLSLGYKVEDFKKLYDDALVHGGISKTIETIRAWFKYDEIQKKYDKLNEDIKKQTHVIMQKK